MKKAFGLLLAVGLLMAAMTTAALAATPGDGARDFADAGSQVGNAHAWGFVDADGDGVNDNFVDADGDGTCDNFVDADGDGINDLRGTLGMGGQGAHGNGTGDCSGDNFVDADGDGVCDNAGTGGMGGGQQRMGGGHGLTP
jgi:hypothetical protein